VFLIYWRKIYLTQNYKMSYLRVVQLQISLVWYWIEICFIDERLKGDWRLSGDLTCGSILSLPRVYLLLVTNRKLWLLLSVNSNQCLPPHSHLASPFLLSWSRTFVSPSLSSVWLAGSLALRRSLQIFSSKQKLFSKFRSFI
jgi:hypothetical protein